MDSPETPGGTGPTNSLILPTEGSFRGLALAAHTLTGLAQPLPTEHRQIRKAFCIFSTMGPKGCTEVLNHDLVYLQLI